MKANNMPAGVIAGIRSRRRRIVTIGANNGFNPATDDRVLAWAAPEHLDSYAHNASVSDWNGFVTTGIGANPLAKTAGLNNLKYVSFAGSHALAKALGSNITGPTTMIVVARPNSAADYSYIFDGNNGTNRRALIFNRAFSPRIYRVTAKDTANVGASSDGAFTGDSGEWRMLDATFGGIDGSSIRLCENGAIAIETTSLACSIDGITLGSRYDGSFDGVVDIHEFILLEGELTKLEMLDVYAYLEEKYAMFPTTQDTYATDFSEFPTAVGVPSTFTAPYVTNGNWAIVDDAGAIGGKILRANAAADGRHHLWWNTPGNWVGKCEVLVICRSNTNTTMSGPGASAHMTGTSSGKEAGQNLYLNNDNGTKLKLNKYLLGVSIVDTSSTPGVIEYPTFPMTINADTWYAIRLKMGDAGLVQGKCWEWGTEEPSEWQIEHTELDTYRGRIGIYSFTMGLHDFQYLSCGLNGASAPLPS